MVKAETNIAHTARTSKGARRKNRRRTHPEGREGVSRFVPYFTRGSLRVTSGGSRGIVRRQTNCVKLLGAGAARTFAHRPERCHQDQVDPGSIHKQEALESAFFLETAGRVGRNCPRIVAEYDKADALVERYRQRLFAEALAAMPFVADPDAEVRRAMYCVDVMDVDIADDLRIDALAYREQTRDASLPVSHEAMTSLRFTGRKAPSSRAAAISFAQQYIAP
jgi:hypothetical protein